MINALFIGGPADGRRMQLGDNVHRVSVPEMPRLDSMVGLGWVDNTIPTPIKDTEYHRHDFLGLPGITIFTVGEMATINILEYLIDGYKAEAAGGACSVTTAGLAGLVYLVPEPPTGHDCPHHILDPYSWMCGAGWFREKLVRNIDEAKKNAE